MKLAWNSLGIAWNCLKLMWNCLELLETRLELLGTRLELAWNCSKLAWNFLELLETRLELAWNCLELLKTRWGLARSCLKSIFIQEPPEAPHAEPRSHPWGGSLQPLRTASKSLGPGAAKRRPSHSKPVSTTLRPGWASHRAHTTRRRPSHQPHPLGGPPIIGLIGLARMGSR